MTSQLPSTPPFESAPGSGIREIASAPYWSNQQLTIFTQLWAVASLFHMAHSSVFDRELNLAFLTIAAFYAIIRPSLQSLLILSLLQLFDAFFRMPMTTNHWIFTAFVNLSVLQTYGYMALKKRSFTIRSGDWFNTFKPILCIEVIILYFFAVFHKLNSGFFSPETSCATELLLAQNLGSIFPVSPSLLAWNAYFTIAIESLIPLLLCFRKTRNAGILFGIFFHSVLSYSSYNAFYDFSSMILATYFVFASSDFAGHVYQTVTRFKKKVNLLLAHFSWSSALKITVLILFAFAFTYVLTKRINTYKEVHLYFFWTAYSVICTCFFIHYLLSKRKHHSAVPQPNKLRLAHWSLLFIPLLVFFNGTSPYLGLKTENSYAMFSNLKTEGGVSNHYLIPASAQIFNYQKDVIEIISSTDVVLQQLANEQKLIVLFEFRNLLKSRKPKEVKFLFNGKQEIFKEGEFVRSRAFSPNPYILTKIMRFRSFEKNGEQHCSH